MMQVFESDNISFLNLPHDVPILSLFTRRKNGSQEILPWMETSTVTEIVTDRLIEVVKNDLGLTPSKTQKAKKEKPKQQRQTKKV